MEQDTSSVIANETEKLKANVGLTMKRYALPPRIEKASAISDKRRSFTQFVQEVLAQIV